MSIDKVFENDIKSKFTFDETVASVFDDMLLRSVPFYKESQSLIIAILTQRLEAGDTVCDLGCSTGNMLLEIAQKIPLSLVLKGIDSSLPMVEQARKKSAAFGCDAEFIHGDFNEVDFEGAKAILSNYTLQFIRPINRGALVKKVYDSLAQNGLFIFSEKLVSKEAMFDKEMIDMYYDFKRKNGYSNTEIAKKREALENVLIPYSEEENILMAKSAGFRHCEILFRWVNFATFVAFK